MTITKEQYNILNNAFIQLSKIHETSRNINTFDFNGLNYYANIIESYHKDPDFNHVKTFILSNIRGF